jgi:hypothetical protein
MFVLLLVVLFVISGCATKKGRTKKALVTKAAVSKEDVAKEKAAEALTERYKKANEELYKIRAEYFEGKKSLEENKRNYRAFLNAKNEEIKQYKAEKDKDIKIQKEKIMGLFNDYKVKLRQVKALEAELSKEFKGEFNIK